MAVRHCQVYIDCCCDNVADIGFERYSMADIYFGVLTTGLCLGSGLVLLKKTTMNMPDSVYIFGVIIIAVIVFMIWSRTDKGKKWLM